MSRTFEFLLKARLPNILGVSEQVAFNSFSFFLIFVLSIFTRVEYFSHFVSEFSYVVLFYSLYLGVVLNPLIGFLAKNSPEQKTDLGVMAVFCLISSFLASLTSALFVFVMYGPSFSLWVPLLVFGWTLFDAIRKINVSTNNEMKNFINTLVMYLLIIVEFFFLRFFLDTDHIYSLVPLLVAISMCFLSFFNTVVHYDLRNINYVGQFSRFWEAGRSFVLGVFLFWCYTQGSYIFAYYHFEDETIKVVRVSQNLTSLISVIMVYIELKFLNSIRHRVDGSFSTARDIVSDDFKRFVFVVAVVTFLTLILSNLVAWKIYGFVLEEYYVLFGALLSTSILAMSKLIVSYCRYNSLSRTILSFHVSAFLSLILVWGLVFILRFDSLFVMVVFLPPIVFSLSTYAYWLKNEYSSC